MTTAGMGHNTPSPFADATRVVDNVWSEAQHWLDGSVAETQAEADAIGQLLDDARKARQAADKARREEAKPYDDGKAEVQARYTPILKRCDDITAAAKSALAPFLAAQEREKRAAAAKARADAEAAQRAAQEAFARVQGIDGRETAEDLAERAKSAEIAARVAAKDTAGATGGARKVGLRTTIAPEVYDLRALMSWIWKNDQSALIGFAAEYVAGAFRAGQKDMDGVRAVEKKAVA